MQLVGGDFFFLAWNCFAGWIGTHYSLLKYKCIPITSMVNGSLLSEERNHLTFVTNATNEGENNSLSTVQVKLGWLLSLVQFQLFFSPV